MGYQLILMMNKKEGAFKSMVCAYIFTGESIVFAHIDKEMIKQIYAKKSAALKAEGVGFVKRSAALTKALEEYVATYHEQSVDEILKDNRMNFEMKNQEIDKIVFRRLIQRYDVDTGNSKSGGTLVIKARGEKIKARHNYGDGRNQVRNYIREVYGKRAK